MERAELQRRAYSAAIEIAERIPLGQRALSLGGPEEDIRRRGIATLIEGAFAGSAVRDTAVYDAQPSLEPTPLAEQTRTEWIRILEPWARWLRKRVFGSADPPFASEDWDQTVAWIEEEMGREVEESSDAAAVIDSEEYRERKQRALADAEWLAERSGLPFALTLTPVPPLAYVKPVSSAIREVVDQVAAAVERIPEDDGITVTDLAGRMNIEWSIVGQRVAQALRAGYLKKVWSRKGRTHRLRPAAPIPEGSQDAQEGEVVTLFPRRRGGHLMTLAVTAEAMAAVSGFEPHEVTAFLLAGVRPSLVRTRVRGYFVLRFRPPTLEEIAKGDREWEVARMKQRLDAALEDAGVSVEEAEKALATLLDRAAESPAESPKTVSNKEARPEFPRAIDPATWEHLLRVPQVTVEFYTPDIRHEDLRKLHGEIRQAWAALRSNAREEVVRIREEARRGAWEDARARGFPVVRRPSPRGRLTDHDLRLLEIIEDMGGVPDRPSADFWEKVQQRWVKARHGPAKNADVHRRHWGRLKLKPPPPTPRGPTP